MGCIFIFLTGGMQKKLNFIGAFYPRKKKTTLMSSSRWSEAGRQVAIRSFNPYG